MKISGSTRHRLGRHGTENLDCRRRAAASRGLSRLFFRPRSCVFVVRLFETDGGVSRAVDQIAADTPAPSPAPAPGETGEGPSPPKPLIDPVQPSGSGLRRFYGTVPLDSSRVGRDAGRIAEEAISHLTSLIGSKVSVTLEVTAQLADDASDGLVRTVLENARTLKFTAHGFEKQ